MSVEIKAILIGKNMVRMGDSWFIKLDFAEEKPQPPLMAPRDSIARDIMPIIEQTFRVLNPNITSQSMVPRMTLWLTDDEWDAVERKPEVGEEVTIVVMDKNKIILR